MIEIRELDYDKFAGEKYSTRIKTDRVLKIEPTEMGFELKWIMCEKEIVKVLEDDMLSEWLDEPVAFGAYDGDELVGFVEGFLEEWCNRYRISNICVFDGAKRGSGIGGLLLDKIMEVAKASGGRMAVLETQSYNYKAISFYKKNGFEIIGFDRFAYGNQGPEEDNMRIEMGIKLGC